ncbi:hypothetical protein IMZ29_14950 [Achromobacter sp. GG226]|uniref:hypothetical protein n=1 Tax=Verticiella alkaliphila TaxID=2779529 RepID=UPI001C0C4D46|nr:hypothetical protein [Verticiella sp. GG226]MBU4611786.1 hypothetical protein [Verticiella sp. GG226]
MRLRIALRFAAVLSLVGLLWHAYQFAATPTAQWYVERSADAIRVSVQRALMTAATPDAIAQRLETALESHPADWPAINMLMAYADDEQIPIRSELTSRIQQRRLSELTLSARAGACVRCMTNPRACPLSEAKICDIAIELTPLGDLRSFKLAVDDYREGRAIDSLDVGLASVGLAATAGAAVTGGASYSAKMGAALIKAGKSAGSLSHRLLRSLKRLTVDLVDFRRLPNNWALHPRKSLEAVDSRKLAQLSATAGAVGALQLKIGPNAALRVLQHADSPGDIGALSRASDALGKRTPVAVEVLGGKRVIRLSSALSPLARRVVGWGVSFLGLIAGLYAHLASAAWAAAWRAVKRKARNAAAPAL